jgi:hypothetical protein
MTSCDVAWIDRYLDDLEDALLDRAEEGLDVADREPEALHLARQPLVVLPQNKRRRHSNVSP